MLAPIQRTDLFRDEEYYLAYNSMWDEQVCSILKHDEARRLRGIENAQYSHWLSRGYPKKGTDKNCKRCNNIFTQTRSDELYCSDECKKQQFLERRRNRRNNRNKSTSCMTCNKKFDTAYGQIYCSRECYNKPRVFKENKET